MDEVIGAKLQKSQNTVSRTKNKSRLDEYSNAIAEPQQQQNGALKMIFWWHGFTGNWDFHRNRIVKRIE